MPGGTWRTMYEEILSNAGRPSGDADKAKRAIVDAIDKHAAESFFFQSGEIRFDTVDGQSGYGDGAGISGLLEVVGPLTLLVEGDATDLFLLPRISPNELLDARAFQAGSEAQPEAWAWLHGRIELFPTPDETIHTVIGNGIFTHGRLTKRHNGTTYVYFTTDGVTELTDNYPESVEVNQWFDAGYTMIRSYAEYILYSSQLHAQAGQVERLLTRYLEHYDALKARTDRPAAVKYVVPMELP